MSSLIQALSNRTPIVWVNTLEPERVISSIPNLLNHERDIYVYDDFDGLMQWNNASQTWKITLIERMNLETSEMEDTPIYGEKQAFSFILNLDDPPIYLIRNAHKTIDDFITFYSVLYNRYRNTFFEDDLDRLPTQIIAFGGDTPPPVEIAQMTTVIHWGLPSAVELRKIITNISENYGEQVIGSAGIEPLIKSSVGLSEHGAIEAYLAAIRTSGKIDGDVLKQLRLERLKAMGTLEVNEPSFTINQVGGLDNAKNLIQRIVWMNTHPDEVSRLKLVPLRRVLLLGMNGCLAGDTLINVNRAGNGFSMPMATLVSKFNGEPVEQHGRQYPWDLSIPTYVARADNGVIRLGRLKAAWESGVKQTYTLITESGRSIRATANHPFMLSNGEFSRLDALVVGDTICVNAGRKSSEWATKNAYRIRSTSFHPYQMDNTRGRGVLEHRLVFEASLNSIDFEEYLDILRNDEIRAKELVYIPSHLVVHHQDDDHTNNSLDNLGVMTRAAHSRHHAVVNNVLEQMGYEAIISIKPYGEEMTYDMEIEDEPHNFVANGFVVHNCGKSLLCEAAADALGLQVAKMGVARAMDKFVGESEKRMTAMFNQVNAMAPISIWIDELGRDLSGGDSSGYTDGGTTSRVHATFLTEMQQLHEGVFLFAAANNIDDLPPEMLRAGRFDKLYFVGFPSFEERQEIFNLYLPTEDVSFDVEELAAKTPCFTGSEIRELIERAAFDVIPLHDHSIRPLIQQDIVNSVSMQKNRVWIRHRQLAISMYKRSYNDYEWASSSQYADAHDIMQGREPNNKRVIPIGQVILK